MTTSKKNKPSIWSERVFLCSLVITFLVLGLFVLTLFYPTVVDGKEFTNKWAYLLQGPPNEIGDTLAGLAGALAFVWLIATVLLQAKEMQKMADAQEEQVDLLVKQGQIFEQEQLERSQLRAKEVLDEKLRSLKSRIEQTAPMLKTSRTTESIFAPISSIFDDHDGRGRLKSFAELEIDEYFKQRALQVEKAHRILLKNFY